MIEQALTQMSEIAVGIAGRRDPLVDLEDMHTFPGQPLVGQDAQHPPRRAAAADRHDEPPARRDGGPYIGDDDGRGLSRDGVVIGMDFDLHATNRLSGFCLVPLPAAFFRPRSQLRVDFSRWPPNSKRIADNSLSANVASPRELNRA